MKFVLVLSMLLPIATFSQQVQNVKASQTNDDVVVSYDLVDTKPAYVSLYYSKDGGVTFSPELRQVAGDVKDKVRPGTNKKISWAVAKELAVFDGDMIFKVEAARKKIGYPKPDADGYFSVEGTNAYFEGPNLKIEFIVTNISKGATLKAQLKAAFILDDQGSYIKEGTVTIANLGYDVTVEYAKDVGYKGVAIIKNANQEMTIVSLLKLNFYVGMYEEGLTNFKRSLEDNYSIQTNNYESQDKKNTLYDSRIYSIKSIPISK